MVIETPFWKSGHLGFSTGGFFGFFMVLVLGDPNASFLRKSALYIFFSTHNGIFGTALGLYCENLVQIAQKMAK